MTGGLETIAAISSRVGLALAFPRIEWESPAIEQQSHVGFEDGVCWAIDRRKDRVIVTAIAEAGAALIAVLDPNDAMTIAALNAAEGT